MTSSRAIIGGSCGCALVWFGLGIPLGFALVIHLATKHLFQPRVASAPPLDAETSRATSWGGTTLFVLVLVSCIHFGFLTRGTGVLLGGELLSGSFDSLADALLRGTTEIDPNTIRWEAFVVEGRSYMYFGPWPALLRIPLHWLAPQQFGLWARLSCFVASMLSVGAFALMSLRMLERNQSLSLSERKFILATSIAGFGLASPLLFLTNAASIYHESILWGFAGSLCFCAVLVPRLEDPASLAPKLPVLAAIAGATLLARVTYGAPLLLVLLLIAGHALRSTIRDRARGGESVSRAFGKLFIALLPITAILLFHLWFNFDRYGSSLKFVDLRMSGYVNADPGTLAILDETGVFNPRRVPTALGNYTIPNAAMISRQFPWFRIASPVYPHAGLYPRIFASYVMALPAMASWLVIGGLLGVFYLFRSPNRGIARLCFAAFAIEALLICAYCIMELRYEVDMMPMLVFGYGLFLAEVSTRGPLKGRAKDIATVLLFTVATSVVVATSGTLSAIALGGPAHPPDYKDEWQQHFRAIDAVMPGRESGTRP